MAACDTYDCAYNSLSTTPIIAPAYFIIAGTKGNEGAVITRDRFYVAHLE